MNNIDKAVKALNMAGIDVGFLQRRGQINQLAISVKGMHFALHEDEIARWAATYEVSVATAPLEAIKLIRKSCLALDMGNRFDEKIRADLDAATELLNLCSVPNHADEGDSPKTDEQ